MFQRRPCSSLLLLLIAAIINNNNNGTVLAQQAKKQQKPLQPLGDVLHLVLDKDKDQKVTMDEVNAQMSMLEALFQNGEGDEAEEYKRLLKGLKSSAPQMFNLLDSNGDNKLTKSELSYATKFEKSLKKGGGLKELVRDVFALLDSNADDQLSVDELLEGSKSSDIISKITIEVHELFPLRKTPGELEEFVKSTIESIGGNNLDKESVASYMEWIDDDGDGYIQRKEVGKYYNVAGRKFLEISKTIKTMGPMMALFGGMDMNGGGGGGRGGGGGFKMDL